MNSSPDNPFQSPRQPASRDKRPVVAAKAPGGVIRAWSCGLLIVFLPIILASFRLPVPTWLTAPTLLVSFLLLLRQRWTLWAGRVFFVLLIVAQLGLAISLMFDQSPLAASPWGALIPAAVAVAVLYNLRGPEVRAHYYRTAIETDERT